MTTALRAAALSAVLLGAASVQAYAAAAAAPQSFPTPDAAADALVKAMTADDGKALMAILGPGGKELINSGDPVVDQEMRKEFLQKYEAKHSVKADGEARATLTIGVDDWPLPVPLERVADGWRWDTKTGAQEILDRRVGHDEIAAIRTCLAYVDAQNEYFDRTKRGLGTGVYAQFLASTPGHYDGLFWPEEGGAPKSPLGPLVDQAVTEGYPADPVAGKQQPYQGYYFHILKAQGENAEKGAANYVVDGKMTGGFALVGWPVQYGNTGVMTFIVNQDGIVFQKDLGPNTATVAKAMTKFDPDITWARVSVDDAK
jgi:hypothetical protein